MICGSETSADVSEPLFHRKGRREQWHLKTKTVVFLNCKSNHHTPQKRMLHKVSILALSVTYGDSSPKGRAFGKKMNFAWTAKGSHFGGAGIAQR